MQINSIKLKTEPISQDYGAKKAALFGSVVRDQNVDSSDVDLLVELGKKLSLLDYIGLQQGLEDRLVTKVDLVQSNRIRPTLKPFIMGDGVVPYQD